MSFSHVCGIWCLWIKNIVLVPGALAGLPCVNWPISLPNVCCHASLYFGLGTSCLYPNNFPMSSSKIAPANLVFLEDWPGCIMLFSNATHMHSCVTVAFLVFDHVFTAGPNANVSWVNNVLALVVWRRYCHPCPVVLCVCYSWVVHCTLGVGGPVHGCMLHPWRWFWLFWCC